VITSPGLFLFCEFGKRKKEDLVGGDQAFSH
jgi:hypothetical protein